MRPDPREYLLNKRAATVWVENTLGEPLDKSEDFFSLLIDGVTLCKVMQRISPALIPRIKIPVIKRRASNFIFKTNENVSFFLQACVEIGVPRHRRFVLHDLVHTQKKETISYASAKRILDCLETLCEVANKYGRLYDFNVKWPVLDRDKEKFSKDELAAAEKLVEVYVRTEKQKVEGLKNHTDQKAEEAKKLERFSQIEMLKKQEADRANKAATRLQALVKGWLARTKYRSMVLHQAYRDKVAHEILATEKVYVEHLEFTFKQLLLPLRHSLDSSSPVLTEGEIRAIFGETEVILNYNKLLLAQLETRVAKWSVKQCLGDIFLQIAGFLKIYSQYVSNYTEAMRVLGECKHQSKFKKFLDDLRKKNSDLEQRGLEDFLIRPVQRIPRYFMLLQDLVRHTAPDHPDYANLASAAQKVQAVAEYMNERKREAENIMKVTEVQDMIEGEFENLAKPSRRFVKEAQMQEITKGTTKKFTVVAFLFNDLLVITKSQGSSWLSRSKVKKLQFSTSFRLSGANIIALDDTAVFQNAFVFLRPTSKRSITLLASSREARDEWVSCIEAEIAGATHQEEAQDKRITDMVADKVSDAKLKLEKQMSSVVDMHRKLSLSLDEDTALSALSNLSSLSATSSGDSDDGTPRSNSIKGMSLREKRIALMNQARKNGSSGGGFTFAASSEAPS